MPTRGGEKVKKNITKSRWGLPGSHPEKEYPPPDPDVPDLAIKKLGDAALDNKASVEREIGFIVNLHRTLRELECDPPRPTDVARKLECVMDSADELRTQIAELDALSLIGLRRHGAFKHPSLVVPIDDTERRGNEFIAIGERQDSRLLSMLESIVEASKQALAELPEDRGGSIKQPMLGESANKELVAGCYKLFDQYRPGKAKRTKGGDFETFVSYLYELSTGEKDVDLERPIREHLQNVS